MKKAFKGFLYETYKKNIHICGSDRNQLAVMAQKGRTAIGSETLEVFADGGYFSGKEIVTCDSDGITPNVPKSPTSASKAQDRYGKQDFSYLAGEGEYLCPAGQRLTNRFSTVENEMKLHAYTSSACGSCERKAQCATGKERRIKCWEHEGILEFMQSKLEKNPDAMLLHKQTVEPPFGTIKHWMGSTHFLMRTLEHVSTEMSLHVLAYNIKRVMSIMGVMALMQAMQA